MLISNSLWKNTIINNNNTHEEVVSVYKKKKIKLRLVNRGICTLYSVCI